MKVTIWGARGSTAVSGPPYLKYGGDTTCVEVRTAAGEEVVLDAGTGMRPLGEKMIAEGRRSCHLLLTHAHWDHLMGFPFFKPIFQKGFVLNVCDMAAAEHSARASLKEVMHKPFFPVELSQVAARINFSVEMGEEFSVGGLRCRSFPLSHPNGGFGYLLAEGGKKLAFFPDNELSFKHPGGRGFEEYVRFLSGADVLLHDAEYLPEEYEARKRGWGHSMYLDTVRLAVEADVKNLVIWHHNQDHGDDVIDRILEDAVSAVAKAGSGVRCSAAVPGQTFTL